MNKHTECSMVEIEMAANLVDVINQYHEWVGAEVTPLFTVDNLIKLIEAGAPIFATVVRHARENGWPVGIRHTEWFERIATQGWDKAQDTEMSWVLNQGAVKIAAGFGVRQGFELPKDKITEAIEDNSAVVRLWSGKTLIVADKTEETYTEDGDQIDAYYELSFHEGMMPAYGHEQYNTIEELFTAMEGYAPLTDWEIYFPE